MKDIQFWRQSARPLYPISLYLKIFFQQNKIKTKLLSQYFSHQPAISYLTTNTYSSRLMQGSQAKWSSRKTLVKLVPYHSFMQASKRKVSLFWTRRSISWHSHLCLVAGWCSEDAFSRWQLSRGKHYGDPMHLRPRRAEVRTRSMASWHRVWRHSYGYC